MKNTRFNDLNIYNFNSKYWKKINFIEGPSKRTTRNGILFRNSLLFFGGFDGDYTQDLWDFDLIEFKWKRIFLKNMPSPRCAHVFCFDERNLYVHGGEASDFSSLNDLFILKTNFKSFSDQIFEKLLYEYFSDCVFKIEPIYC